MAAGGLPTPQVLLDDGTGTFPYDITEFCRLPEGLTGARGRQDELAQTTAQQITLVFDNTNGEFTMGSTLLGSPSPIKLDAQVRVKLTAGATTVNRYTGSLSAAPASWPGGGDEFTLVKATLIDPQAQFDRRPLQSWVEEEYKLDDPVVIWTLNEPSSATAASDKSGSQACSLVPAGAGTAVAFGSGKGPVSSAQSGAQFASGQRLSTLLTLPVPIGSGFTLPFSFTTTLPSVPLLQIYDTLGGLVIGVYLDSAGRLSAGNDIGVGQQGSHLNDGLPHMGVVTVDATGILNVRVDGSLPSADVPVWAGAGPGTSTVRVEVGGFSADMDAILGSAIGTVYTGSLADVALFAGAITSTRLDAWAAAAVGFAGESGTDHLTRVAGYANMPIGSLDASLTNVADAPIEGRGASAVAQDIAEAEFGIAYFNGSGSIDFHNRNRGPLKTSPDITVDANFLDEGTEIEWDMQGVVNYLEVTAAGTSVTQIAWNSTSELTNKHGRYAGDSKTYLVQTDAEALDRGNWIVNTKGEPLPRAGTLVVDLMTMTKAQQDAWLLCEPDYWLRITGLPATTHGGTTLEVVVEGWAESMNADAWTLTLNVVSRSFFSPVWILGDSTYSVLGSTTRLYI